jgi:hypothetical protein
LATVAAAQAIFYSNTQTKPLLSRCPSIGLEQTLDLFCSNLQIKIECKKYLSSLSFGEDYAECSLLLNWLGQHT